MEQLEASFCFSCGPFGRERGVTTIELMISITISLIVLSALSYLYVGSRSAYRTNESLARVQEGGRAAVDWISRDLAASDFIGPGSRGLTVAITSIARPAIVAFNDTTRTAVMGYENGSGWTGSGRLRGDVVQIRGIVGSSVELVESSDETGRRVRIKNNCIGLRQWDYAMLSTFQRVVVFRVTNDPGATSCAASGAEVYLEHQDGQTAPVDRGNGTFGDSSSSTLNPVIRADDRAIVSRFADIEYFVGTNPAGRPALFRAANGGTAEELVENVWDLDVMYGVDTSASTEPSVASEYQKADAVTVSNWWPRVVSIRVSVLVTGADLGAVSQPQTYFFRDTGTDGLPDVETAPDTRLYQVFSATIPVRNRLQ